MGLFTSMKNPCALCGGPTPRLFATEVEGRPICGDCKDKIDLPDGVFPGMSLDEVQRYMAFYQENQPLRDIYQESFFLPCGGWNDQLSLDMEHRLFRIRLKGDPMALEASCLQAFRILEDDNVLFESSPEGLKCHASDIPARAEALAPEIANFRAQYQQYEHIQEMEKIIKEKTDAKTSSSFQYMSQPRFDARLIQMFLVELTLEHPYWGGVRTLEYNKAPGFSESHPDVDTFLRSYRKQTEKLHTLASGLMSFIDPDAPEIQLAPDVPVKSGESAEAVRTVPVVDPVAEIQRYKALLDSGAITQEEFEAKKRQLLGI